MQRVRQSSDTLVALLKTFKLGTGIYCWGQAAPGIDDGVVVVEVWEWLSEAVESACVVAEFHVEEGLGAFIGCSVIGNVSSMIDHDGLPRLCDLGRSGESNTLEARHEEGDLLGVHCVI
jgi:hypothetical protein